MTTAPSAVALQKILDCLDLILKKLCLRINTDKSAHILFESKNGSNGAHPIFLSGKELNKVSEIKYLGIIISDNLSLKSEIERCTNAFLMQFNGFYQKFKFIRTDINSFLFKTYTSSFYGCNLWFEEKYRDALYRKISVAYHKAVKKVAGRMPWDANHEACSIVKVNLFSHLLAKRMLNYFFSLLGSPHAIISSLRYYLMFSSGIKSSLAFLFKQKYGIERLV